MLMDAGLGPTLRLLTSGTVPADTLRQHAQDIVAQMPHPLPPTGNLRTVFAEAGVPIAPYAYALDVTGETVLPLIEAGAVGGDAPRPILSDDDWVALQNICGG